jgi:hypothetical protein
LASTPCALLIICATSHLFDLFCFRQVPFLHRYQPA